ncbi:MAG: alpha glucosidase [Azospirillaceae bacterium]
MTEWWRGAVIYQIYPRSFRDTDGDGIGDLPGVRERLAHVAALGADGVWLSPFYPSPMADFGYDIADYTGVDPVFGTLADFDAVVAEAHRLGLKLIVDQVWSHCSDRHPWFEESRADRINGKADWFIWADPKPDGAPPNNWQSVFGGPAWSWEPRRRQYYLHNFLAAQPDLNFHSPAVQDAILDVARFWLDRGVDGFRLDVANFYVHDASLADNPARPDPDAYKPYSMQQHVHDRSRPETLDFMRRLRALLDGYDDRMAVAEIVSDRPLQRMAEYTGGPGPLHTAYSFVFLDAFGGARFVRDAVEAVSAHAPQAWPAWAFSNHDKARVLTRWGGPEAGARTACCLLALLASLRGTAFVYQGEELGLPEADVPFERLQDPEGRTFWPTYKGRDGCRTPIPWRADAANAGFGEGEPWLPVDPRHVPLAVDRQEDDPASTLNFARHFLAWRKRHPALVTGDIRFLDTPEPVLAFERRVDDGPVLVCAFNLGEAPVEVRLPGLSGTPTADTESGLDGTFDGQRAILPGWGAAIGSLE